MVQLRFSLVLLFLLALGPRLAFLSFVPAGIHNDEIDYILNTKAVYYAGTDISGRWSPWSLTTPQDEEPKGELLPVLLAPLLGPWSFSLFLARLPGVLLGVLAVFLVYLVARKLFSPQVGLWAGFLAAINPLAIFNSRTIFDSAMAAVFYLLAVTVLLYARGWLILLSLVPLFLAFYTYIGAKLLLLPLVGWILAYCWRQANPGKFRCHYLLVGLATTLILAVFLVRLPGLGVSRRTNSLFTPFHPQVAAEVDKERQRALESPLNTVFSNKAIVYLREVANRYLGAISPSLLFFGGDTVHYYFLWSHGIFYYLDGIFLVLGFYSLRTFPKTRLFFLGLLILALIPSIASGTQLSYTLRSYLFYLLLIMVAGLGLARFFVSVSRGRLIAVLIGGFYFFLWAGFSHDYFLRNPVYHEDQFLFPFRTLARYVTEEEKSGRTVTVVGTDPRGTFQQYVLYRGLYDRLGDSQLRATLAEKFRSREYSWGGVLFTDDCQKPSLTGTETVILRRDRYCGQIQDAGLVKERLAITRLSDAGEEFQIYFGQTCQQFSLGGYSPGIVLNDLLVEKLPLDRYCQRYVTRTLIAGTHL